MAGRGIVVCLLIARSLEHDRLQGHPPRVGTEFPLQRPGQHLHNLVRFAAACLDLLNERIAEHDRPRKGSSIRHVLLQPNDGDLEIGKARFQQRILDRINAVVARSGGS
jgi:hypothetical protein